MTFKDPVCGKRIDRDKAHITIEYEGVDYFLCCPQCQAQFERSPKTFAKPLSLERVHDAEGLKHESGGDLLR